MHIKIKKYGAEAPYIFIMKTYMIDMDNTRRNHYRKEVDFTMNEIGEIVVIQIPAGETVICG